MALQSILLIHHPNDVGVCIQLEKQLIQHLNSLQDVDCKAKSIADHDGTLVDSADIILLLISKALLGSNYCLGSEFLRIIERQSKVVGVILDDCNWQTEDFEFQILPAEKPVAKWNDRTEALEDVAQQVEKLIEKSPPKRRWHLHSTPATAEKLEFSLLAILETIAATSILVGAYLYLGTLLPVAVGACTALFLLTRTNQSTQLGLRLCSYTQTHILAFAICFGIVFMPVALHFGTTMSLTFFLIFIVVMGPVFAFVANYSLLPRILAGSYTLARHPFRSLQAIPDNWYRIAFCIDTYHPPERVPGIELSKETVLRYSGIYSFFLWWIRDHLSILVARNMGARRFYDGLFGLLLTPLVLVMLSALFVVAMAYRWSLKSTTFVFLPFIWVVTSNLRSASHASVKQRLKHIRQHETVQQIYSGIVIIVCFLFPLVEIGTWNLFHSELGPALRPVLRAWFPISLTAPAHFKMEWWHIARLVSCLTAILLFVLANWGLRRIDDKRLSHGQTQLIGWIIFDAKILQVVLGLYTVLCTIIIVWRLESEAWLAIVDHVVDYLKIFRIGEDLLP